MEKNALQKLQEVSAELDAKRAELENMFSKSNRSTSDEEKIFDARVAISNLECRQKDLGIEVGVGQTPIAIQEQMMRSRNGGNHSFDDSEVRVYKAGESIVDAYQHILPDGIKPGDLSAGRFIRSLVTGDWNNAQAERRAMSTLDDTLGGFALPSPMSARVIDKARNQSVLNTAGMLTVPMESSTLTLARVTQDPAGTWKAENALGTESAVNFGAIKLTAKTLFTLVRVSLELIEDAPNAASVIENSIASAMALEIDRVGLFGTGANNQPLGLFYDPDLSEESMGANGAALTDYDEFIDSIEECWAANGSPSTVIYSPRTAAKLAKLKQATELAPLEAPQIVRDLRHLRSTQISDALTQGSSDITSVAFFGGFENLLFGARGSMRIEVSREADDAFTRGQVLIRAYVRGDFATTHSDQICRLIGIL